MHITELFAADHPRRWTHLRLVGATWFVFCAHASIMPHTSRYYDLDLHLNDFQIGFLMATPALCTMLMQPVWGILADRYIGRSNTYRLGLSLASISLLLFVLSYDLGGYPLLLVSACLVYCTFMSNAPLLSSLILSFLGKDKSHEFANIRVVGSMSFAFTIFAVCPLMVLLSQAMGWYNRTAVFLSAACFIWIAISCTFWDESHFDKQERPPMRSFLALFKNWNLVALYASIFWVAAGAAAGFQYLGPYIGHRGLPEIFFSTIWLVGVGCEVILSLLMSRLIQRFGLKRIIAFGIASDALRWTLMSGFASPYVILLANLGHGPAILAIFYAPTVYLDTQCDAQIRSTAQAMVYISVAAGQITGFLSGSAIVSSYSELARADAIQHSFFWFGLASLIGAAISTFLLRTSRPKEPLTTLPMDEMAA